MSARRFLGALLIIAGAALVLRAVYIVTVTRNETAAYDNVYYVNQAKIVGAGHGWRTLLKPEENADHPPLTVLALAPVSRLTDGDEDAMRVTVALVGVAAVVLVGLIGREVAGERVGLLAAGIAALYPNLWMNDGLVMAEAFSALFVAATVLLALRIARAPSVPRAVGLGLVCGLAMLSRGELALLVPLVALPVLWRLRDVTRRRRLELAGVTVLVAGLTIAPWVAYNLSRFDDPVFLSTGDGGVLLGANCDAVYSGDLIGFWDVDCAADGLLDGEDGSKDSSNQRRLAFEYIGDHLERVPVVMAARVGRAFSLYAPGQMAAANAGEGRPRWASWLGFATYWALVPAAVYGVLLLRRRGVALLPLLVPVAIVVVVTAFSYGIVRFRVPAEVSLVVLGAVGADAALGRMRR